VPRWPKKNPRPGVDEYGRAPLWYQAANGDLDGVIGAVAAGADPGQGDDAAYTPLHVAVQNGHISVIEYLLRAGADPNALDKHGNGPLWVVTLRPQMGLPAQVEIIALLLRAGANPNHENLYGRSSRQMAHTIANGLEDPFLKHESGAV